MKTIIKSKKNRIYQGDIIKDVQFIQQVFRDNRKKAMVYDIITFPMVIVLSQDCDLSNKPERLISILVCPIYNYAHIIEDTHLDRIYKYVPQGWSKCRIDCLIQNETPRYNYLEFDCDYLVEKGVLDFKHYFSVNYDYLLGLKRSGNQNYRLNYIIRENLANRFSNYLSRVGIPNDDCKNLFK